MHSQNDDRSNGIETIRRELKVVLPETRFDEFRAWLDERAPRDAHDIDPQRGYGVTSIYFDTPDFEILSELYDRAENRYRVRWYEGFTPAWFERKMALGNSVSKRRWKSDIHHLKSHVKQLANRQNEEQEISFAAQIADRRLVPTLAVTFRRLVWEPAPGVRIALDRSVRSAATETYDPSALATPTTAVLPGQLILELKTCGEQTNSVLEDALALTGSSPDSVSKYALCAAALGLGDDTLTSSSSAEA